MIQMTNGVERLFVFDSAVRYYRSIGYVPVEEAAPEPAIVDDLPEETVEEAPVEEAAPDDYEPNAEGKYVCPHCGKDYSTKANLIKHIESKHPETL